MNLTSRSNIDPIPLWSLWSLRELIESRDERIEVLKPALRKGDLVSCSATFRMSLRGKKEVGRGSRVVRIEASSCRGLLQGMHRTYSIRRSVYDTGSSMECLGPLLARKRIQKSATSRKTIIPLRRRISPAKRE